MPETDPTPTPAWFRLVLVLLLVTGIASFYLLGLQRYFDWETMRTNLHGWQSWTQENWLQALALYLLVYVLVVAFSLPIAVLLSLLGGALFGRWVGTGVASLAATLGATLAFLNSRYILGDWVQARFGSRLEAIHRGIERDGAYYLFTLRLIPAVPFFLVNLAMGLTRMRAWTYALVTWLGMLPATFLFVNAGTELGTLESPAGLLSWPVLLSLALLGVVPLVLRRLLQYRQKCEQGP